MNLIQCQTCGASDFTNGKCDYCRNQYEVDEDKLFYGNSIEDDSSLDEDITFQETKTGKLILKIMIYTLVSIIWFAVTVFIPPLFIITIILLIVLVRINYNDAERKKALSNTIADITALNDKQIFSIDKIYLYSSADAINNQTKKSMWDLDVYQFTEIAMYISAIDDGLDNTDNRIDSIYIDNIKFSRDLSTKVVERVELPYFKETFVSENGEVVKGLEFPFKIRVKNDCNYYVFSSGKSGYKEDNSTVTDLVRINEKRTHLDYWFDVSDDDSNIVKDMNGVNGWGGSINEPGYFPFNKPEDGSKIENLNYGFGTKLEIPFTLTQDGQVKTINNNEKRDIQFNFKGDDDVWVYIDGNLVLDMGGAHSQTVGNINFKNRTATVDRVIKGSFRSHNLYQETGKSIKNFTLSNDSYINGDTSQGLVLCQYFGHKKSNFFMLHF